MVPVSKHSITDQMIALLRELISIPSISKEEHTTATMIETFLQQKKITVKRKNNNVWAKNKYFNDHNPTILLNSHHDTVRPNPGYTRDPFAATIEEGKLYGLGSNDAGGALVSLLGAFLYFYDKENVPLNIIYAATAEEEISGRDGIESIIADLGNIEAAIVGEPTLMSAAVAERGLLVLDCTAHGIAAHAARNEGVNAIYKAMDDIQWFRAFTFDKVSPWLGAVGINVTQINAGTAHNQVPAACTFVVDIRLNECYTHEDVLGIIRGHVKCDVRERSTRMKPSFIDIQHPLILAAKQLYIPLYGSPTTSDMALMPWQAVKMGPGDSARSHSADEFIYIHEIEEGIKKYIELLEAYSVHLQNQTA
jgi:acetylornithine deacetylase